MKKKPIYRFVSFLRTHSRSQVITSFPLISYQDLPALERVDIGSAAFFSVRSVQFKTLPSLTSLQFGVWACYGNDTASEQYNLAEFIGLL